MSCPAVWILSIWPPAPGQPRLVSLIDDTIDIWRDEDLSLLSDVSDAGDVVASR